MNKQDLKIKDTVQQYGIQVNNRGWCLCPFHNDKNPSMHINEQKNKAFCNVCNIALDPIAFMMQYEGVLFDELIKRIEGGIEPDRKAIAKRKHDKAESERNDKLVKRAIEVIEDYIVMLDRYKHLEVDSREFAVYCHNWEFANYISNSLLTGEWVGDRWVKNYNLALPWVNDSVELLKRMARGEALLGGVNVCN